MENEKTIISFSGNDRQITIEMPWDATMEDMCQAFFTGCVGMTFMPSTVIEGVRDYAEEMCFVCDKNENLEND